MSNNYTLGRGELYFARYLTDTTTPDGERYLGNTPEFNLTIEAENLDHFSSDRGIKEKDDSVVLQTTRTGQFSTDNIDPKNLALFFFGDSSVLSVVGATVTDEPLAGVKQGLYYQLGVSAPQPAGVRGLDVHTAGPPPENIIVTSSDGLTTYDETDDYEIDMDLARLRIVEGGAIADDSDLKVSYKTATRSREQVISGAEPVEGALRFIARNPKGKNYDYFMPYVKLSPNGDFALKGEEWQVIPFNIELLKKTDLEAIYLDGRAFVAV